MNEVYRSLIFLLLTLTCLNCGKLHSTFKTFNKYNPHSLSIGSILRTRQSLHQGNYLISNNGRWRFYMQKDGNCVLYEYRGNKRRPIWATDSNGKGNRPYKLTMKRDGNLVILDGNKDVIWASDTSGKGAQGHYLKLHNNRNLVIYSGKNYQIWSSNTILGYGRGSQLVKKFRYNSYGKRWRAGWSYKRHGRWQGPVPRIKRYNQSTNRECDRRKTWSTGRRWSWRTGRRYLSRRFNMRRNIGRRFYRNWRTGRTYNTRRRYARRWRHHERRGIRRRRTGRRWRHVERRGFRRRRTGRRWNWRKFRRFRNRNGDKGWLIRLWGRIKRWRRAKKLKRL